MIRLFVDCHCFDQGGQGTASYIRGLYNRRLIQLVDVEFYFGAYDIEGIKNIFGDACNVHYVKYPNRNKYFRLLFLIPYFQIKYKIDYTHLQYYLPPVNFSKTLVTIHDVLFLDFPAYFPSGYRKKNRLLFGLSIRWATKVLTVSEYSKSRIAWHYGIPQEDLHLTPNSLKEYSGDGTAVCFQGKQYILFVSRIEKRKNHLTLCKAFLSSSRKDAYNLVLVGRKDIGSDCFFDYYSGLSKEDKSKIIILENVNDDSLRELYMGASLFVFPSLCEGFGIPPLEAINYGVSTICAKNTGMEDYDFLEERFFDAQNEASLREKIELFVDNRAGMQSIKERMLHRYSEKKVTALFVDFLKEL